MIFAYSLDNSFMRFPSVYLQVGYTNLKQLIRNLELLDAKTLFFQQLFVMHRKQVRLCVMAVMQGGGQCFI